MSTGPPLHGPESVRELTDLLLSTESFEEYAQQIVELAAQRVLAGSSCGLSLRRDGRVSTAASSDDLASQVDEAQYGSGEGPCLEAIDAAAVVLVVDLADEERWSGYRLQALAQGVRSSLSIPIVLRGEATGALNLYSVTAGAFTGEHAERAVGFADQAAGALALAMRLAEQVSMAGHLQAAMSSRSIIDQAIGIVMAQNRVDGEAAFALLRRASQNRNVKLRQVAHDIVTVVGGAPARPAPPLR